jgi:hypothetical protein
METEEQMARRLEFTRMISDEISREMVREIKRATNKAPTVSDKIRRLPNK